MADATDRYAHSIFPSRGLCAKNADVDRREVGPFQTDAFGMQPVTARFAVQLVSGWWCHLQGRGGGGDIPLNHQVATIIHGIADASGTVTWVAISVRTRCCEIRVCNSRRRRICFPGI